MFMPAASIPFLAKIGQHDLLLHVGRLIVIARDELPDESTRA
jgi:hypothetical protein